MRCIAETLTDLMLIKLIYLVKRITERREKKEIEKKEEKKNQRTHYSKRKNLRIWSVDKPNVSVFLWEMFICFRGNDLMNYISFGHQRAY